MKKEQKQKLDNISRTQGYYNWEHMKVNDVETIEDAMLLGFEIGQQVKSVDLADVVVPKGKLCDHAFKHLKFVRDRQIVCKCGERFSY